MTALADVGSLAELNVPADGAALLDRIHAALARYVVLPSPEAAVGVTLWIAATHAVTAWQHASRLAIGSPEKRCGKSRLLDVIEALCHAPLMTVNATVAAIMRSIPEDNPPTLLFDEADTLWGTKRAAEGNEDLRGLLNAGWQRGRTMLRCEGESNEPREFPTFAMAALAGIGRLPDTITDRSVQVVMRRRGPGETTAAFRQRRDVPPLHALRDEVADWLAGHVEELEAAEPEMPLGVEDRAADVWEPLLAVADLAGGSWPSRARAACRALVVQAAEDDADDSDRLRLLADLREVLDLVRSDFITSADLVQRMRALPESPWADQELNPTSLSKLLREYRIKPDRHRVGDAATGRRQVRGYRVTDFAEVFARYLPDDSAPAPSETPSHPSPPSHPQVTPVTGPAAVTGSNTGLPVTAPDSAAEPPSAVTVRPPVTPPEHVTAATCTNDGCDGCDGCSETGPEACPRCRWGLDTQGHRIACGTDRNTTTTRRN